MKGLSGNRKVVKFKLIEVFPFHCCRLCLEAAKNVEIYLSTSSEDMHSASIYLARNYKEKSNKFKLTEIHPFYSCRLVIWFDGGVFLFFAFSSLWSGYFVKN